MKKINMFLGVVLALIVMFSAGVVMYEKGYAKGDSDRYKTESLYEHELFTNAWNYGYEYGINDYSDYVQTQNELRMINSLKDFGKELLGKEKKL